MNLRSVRENYLQFFEARGHKIIPSAALVPENDPTTLFVGSGMQPIIPYLLGQKHPLGNRITNSQKCFRAEDIEEVGDNRHTTFFEMLGNWSLGDYFKEEQLSWLFEFLTDKIGLDPEKLYVTVFAGDPKNDIPRDEESVRIWKRLFAGKGIEAKDVELLTEEKGGELGMQNGRIFYYDAKKNWWSRAGVPGNMPAGEPGGPDSEIFYEFSDVEHDENFGKYCHPNCDCGRFMEIANSVFMEYQKQKDGTFEKLAQRNVDFGGGLERITAASINSSDVFLIDALNSVIKKIEQLSEFEYEGPKQKSFRVIADHIRGAVFMIGDGVLPSNTDRGYFVRRLLRRAVRHADVLRMEQGRLADLAEPVIESYGDQYPEIAAQKKLIIETIQKEESRFRETLLDGHKELIKLVLGNPDATAERTIERISGKDLFHIYSTYGFPLEVSFEEIETKILPSLGYEDLSEDFYDKDRIEREFKEELKKHQEVSRAGVEKKFRGGLADTKEETVRLHTAHHLLLAALREVLGDHVHQRGSNITAERLRIDFSHPQKVTSEELKQIEDLVNQKIQENLDMIRKEMPHEEAMKFGAEMEFGVKYGDMVSVYVAQDKDENIFSKEFCGGPHVEHTGDLGRFKIIKEEAVSAGIRRIRGVLE